MAKTIFHVNEVANNANIIQIQLAKFFEEKKEEEEVLENVEEAQISEPSNLETVQKEIEELKAQWEEERQKMLDEAHQEAEKIIKEAQSIAFEEVKRQTDEVQVKLQSAKDEAERVIEDAKKNADSIILETENNKKAIETKGFNEGFSSGREEGFKEGSAEVNRLIERMHTIVEKTMEKRQEILSETEQQIVDLVLLLARKVVKVISENQKNVVISNVIHALRKVKTKGDVTIRVNLLDVQMTTDHIKDFLEHAESVQNITVVEDIGVDQGGCIVETDFGSIDARISSQLHELEQKIIEISPIKTQPKQKNG